MKYDKLFADFEGRSVSELHGEICYADWDGMHSVKYETWDWIMPIWYKFREMSKEMNSHPEEIVYKGHCYRIANAVSWLDIYDAIEKLSSAIKWYNSQVVV
jgi:hypothetical protein